MEYGFQMGTRGVTAEPDAIAELAQLCDGLGFAYFGVNDHVVVTTDINSDYPYSADGKWVGAGEGTCLETLTTMGFIAASTKSIRLLTSVLVLPYRPAVLAAKMLTTVDVLSKGRLTVGVGVGWMREELTALDAPPYERRGSASNEYMVAFRALWTAEVAEFHGEFVDFSGVVCHPKPVQAGGPPLWIGGETPAARERVARHGDGWYPVGRNPKFPLDSASRFQAMLGDVRRRTELAERDPSALAVAMYAPWCCLGKEVVEDGRRLPFTGSAEAIRDDVGEYERAGLQTLLLNFDGSNLAQTASRCQAFADAIALH